MARRTLAQHTFFTPTVYARRYSNRVWQAAYFEAPKTLSHEERTRLANEAYELTEAYQLLQQQS